MDTTNAKDERSAEAYFTRLGENRFCPTSHVGGAWQEDEQHISPMNGLVIHAVERIVAARAEPDAKSVARLSVDILGPLPMDEFELRVETIRSGRSIELLEATVSARGRPAVRTRVWRLQDYETAAIAGGQGAALPPPDSLAQRPLDDIWPGGYIASLDVRPVTPRERGRAVTWISTQVQLIAGEHTSDLARYFGLIDTANGIAIREPIQEWLFPNIDLTVHLHRQPVGTTVGFDTTVVFGPSGQGVTSTVLHDIDGPVGTAQQELTVRKR